MVDSYHSAETVSQQLWCLAAITLGLFFLILDVNNEETECGREAALQYRVFEAAGAYFQFISEPLRIS
jgi:hypothetical protein